jgi:hypothetical protein
MNEVHPWTYFRLKYKIYYIKSCKISYNFYIHFLNFYLDVLWSMVRLTVVTYELWKLWIMVVENKKGLWIHDYIMNVMCCDNILWL